jgi:hypothetical protein
VTVIVIARGHREKPNRKHGDAAASRALPSSSSSRPLALVVEDNLCKESLNNLAFFVLWSPAAIDFLESTKNNKAQRL